MTSIDTRPTPNHGFHLGQRRHYLAQQSSRVCRMQLTTGEYAISKEVLLLSLAKDFSCWHRSWEGSWCLSAEPEWAAGSRIPIVTKGKPGIATFFRYRSVSNICLWSAVLHVASLWWEGYLGSFMRSLYHPVLEAADHLFKNNKIWSGSSCDGSTVLSPRIQKLQFSEEVATVWDESQKSCSWELSAAGVTPLDEKGKGLGRGGSVWSLVLCYNFTFGDPDFLLTNLKRLFFLFIVI